MNQLFLALYVPAAAQRRSRQWFSGSSASAELCSLATASLHPRRQLLGQAPHPHSEAALNLPCHSCPQASHHCHLPLPQTKVFSKAGNSDEVTRAEPSDVCSPLADFHHPSASLGLFWFYHPALAASLHESHHVLLGISAFPAHSFLLPSTPGTLRINKTPPLEQKQFVPYQSTVVGWEGD